MKSRPCAAAPLSHGADPATWENVAFSSKTSTTGAPGGGGGGVLVEVEVLIEVEVLVEVEVEVCVGVVVGLVAPASKLNVPRVVRTCFLILNQVAVHEADPPSFTHLLLEPPNRNDVLAFCVLPQTLVVPCLQTT